MLIEEFRPNATRSSTPFGPPTVLTPPTVTGFRTTRVTGGLDAIAVDFTETMTRPVARTQGSYRPDSAGRDRRFGTRDDWPLDLGSAAFDPGRQSVTLRPRKKVALDHPLLVLTSGSGTPSNLALNALDGTAAPAATSSAASETSRWRRRRLALLR